MSYVTVRDDAIWARHVEDPAVRERIRSLSQNEPLTLLFEGTPVRFVKMRDGLGRSSHRGPAAGGCGSASLLERCRLGAASACASRCRELRTAT